MRNLVIVESPSKATTINSYLGKDYKVLASVGHVRDLPKSTLGVDIEHDFKLKYINIKGKSELINQLKKEAKAADMIYLATDPDREGEAISWHLASVLGVEEDKIRRVAFNEITKNVILHQIENPRDIDMNLVNSQQARRALDRIVGYKLSPYLWKTIKSGLSAGRVQSVATRLIAEREAEIKAFVPSEYWTIDAELKSAKAHTVKAKFFGTADGKKDLSCEADANEVLAACENGEFTAVSVKRAQKSKSPMPPFTTSSLLQEASKRLGFQSKRIMKVAQELYEGINLGEKFGGSHGIITYMRTDSLRISDEAAEAAREYIMGKFGREYYPPKRRIFKTGEEAQDAHEAIRPADMHFEPDAIKKMLTSDQYKLYKLVWDRFLASQMRNAEFNTLNVEIECGGYIFRSAETAIKFKGYLLAYDDGETELGELYDINEGEKLTLKKLTPKQNFTDPPSHYTEGSLIKVFKEKGIARPSTYASTITTIIDRGYVERDKKLLKTTPLGEAMVELMKKNFPHIVDYKFTANMEDDLDEIADGKETYEEVLTDFYKDFEKTLEKAQKHISENKVEVPLEECDMVCEKCGGKMVIRKGRFGRFAACINYPECKYTVAIDANNQPIKHEKVEPEKTDMKCELCGSDMVIRTSRYGKFYACSNFPKCKNTKPIREHIGVKCPKCGGEIVKGFGKNHSMFYSCEKYPECDFSSWDLPTADKCPKCGGMLFVKKGKGYKYCGNKDCGYSEVPEKTEK